MKLAQLLACAVALSVAGCAGSGSSASQPVNVSISAPTSGATVGVHQVMVTGSVVPVTAQVSVDGKPAQVSGGSFRRTLWVSAQNQRITVTGAARGYSLGSATTSVTYSPNVAAQLVADTASWKKSPPVSAGPAGSHLTAADQSAINSAFGLSPGARTAARARGRKTTSSTPARKVGSAGGSGKGGSSAPSGKPSGGSSGSSGKPSGGSSGSTPTPPHKTTPAPPPKPTPAQITAAIKHAWVHGCIKARKGANIVPYCTCTYKHLQSAGALSTQRRLHHLLRQLRPYERSGDFSKLPRLVRRAVSACLNKYPPTDPVKGRPKVKRLPTVNHPASSSTTGGGQSTQSTTP